MLGLGVGHSMYSTTHIWRDDLSLYCDGTGDYAAVTTNNMDYSLNDGTVSAWVRGDTFGADGVVVDIISSTANHAFEIFYDDSEEKITFIRTDGDTTATLTHTITDSNITANWYHIAATWNYAEVGGRGTGVHTLYVNGSN